MKRREGFERLEQEIVKEKAAALGRAGERLEAALDEAAALGRALDAETDPGRRAAQARTMLLIQREAIGLRRHRVVDQQFLEPPRRS
jgi:hypothetical protein